MSFRFWASTGANEALFIFFMAAILTKIKRQVLQMTDLMLIKLPFMSICSLQRGLSQAAFKYCDFYYIFYSIKITNCTEAKQEAAMGNKLGARPCPLQEHLGPGSGCKAPHWVVLKMKYDIIVAAFVAETLKWCFSLPLH